MNQRRWCGGVRKMVFYMVCLQVDQFRNDVYLKCHREHTGEIRVLFGECR